MLELTSEEIASIVQSVFEATFAVTTEQLDGPPDTSAGLASSLVGISGEWDGAVIVDCCAATAITLASRMFGVPEEQVARDQLEDTLGELANMIGGNVKALLPPPCSLSLPTVVEGRDYRVRVPGAEIVRDLHFRVLGGQLRVLIAERGK